LPIRRSILGLDSKSKEILLVFPGKYKAPDPQIPLALLHIASPLQKAGYKVRIIDMRIEDYRNFNIGSPVFVGISCMSGLQIRYGLEFARKVRAEKPNVSIVWGGVHPTLLPEQTAANEYVDIVVRGEGEMVVAKLADKLAFSESLDNVAGITYRVGSVVKNNPDAQLIDLNDIPVDLPYDLLQMGAYPAVKSGRIHIQTSRGCPHRCGFCYNTIFNKRAWRGKSASRVLDEIEYLVKKFPNAKIIDPIDDNVFVDKKRVEDICNGIIARGIKVAWRANCRFDYLSTYDKDFINLLSKAGCVELDFGGETGSDRLQKLICKDVTAEQMLQSVANLKKWAPSIEPYVSWMSGLPGETDQDLKATFDLMDRMVEANPRTQHYGIFVYTPFPSPVLGDLPAEFKPPQTLEQWGDIDVFHFKPPWHSKKQVAKLEAISAVTRLAFFPEARIKERGLGFKLSYGIMNRLARNRWKRRYFGIPLELRLVNAVAKKLKGYL
jgi:anaerobic magnesium-protoporphyrin IX monomethyl ester cyclase